MSIAEQITKSAQNLSNARKAILLKGGNVGDNPAFNNLASEIESIPSGDANYVLVDDTDTAHRKQILTGAAPLAKLKSIGGMTYKRQKIGENLLPSSGTVTTTKTGGGYVYLYPSLVDDTTGAIELDAGEYIITLNLTADAPIYANFIGVTSINGDYANGSSEGTDAYRFTLSEKTTITSLTCDYELVTDAEAITVTYTPSLIKVEYELVDSKVTEIINHGANLAKMVNGNHTLNTRYSITMNDGHIRLDRKGTSSAGECSATTYHPYTKVSLPAGTYVIKCNNLVKDKISTTGMYVAKSNGENIVNGRGIDGANTFTLDSPDTITWGIYAYEGTNYTADGYLECDVMLNLGTTTLPYKPYREPITYVIPEALRGTGKGVEGYADTIDLERGVHIKRCKTVVLNGSERWFIFGNASTFYTLNLSDAKYAENVYCMADKFNGAVSGGGSANEMGDCWFQAQIEYPRFYIRFPTYITTEQAAKDYLSNNPVTLTYALAEPIETDLPETFSNLIEVEGGGSLEFVNEYSNAVPSHISYLRRIV